MSLEKDIIDMIKTASSSKSSGEDATATVVRTEGSTAWVHFDGGVPETPVQMSIDCKAGDTVRVRVVNGEAFILGNNSAPPTDDSTAKAAYSKATNAQATATTAIKSTKALKQTVEEEYVESGDSNVKKLSSTLLQNSAGVNIYNDIDAAGSSYAHIDGAGFEVKRTAAAGVIDDANDIQVAHFGDHITLGEDLTGTNDANTIAIGSGNLNTTGSHSTAIGYAAGTYSTLKATGTGASARGMASSGGTIESSGAGSSADGSATDGHIISSGTGSHARGYSGTDGTIAARADGSTAQGCADDDGSIVVDASAKGASASGYAENAYINAVSEGSIAEGYSYGGNIIGQKKGSHAEGYSNLGDILAKGLGAYAHGSATDYATIEASGEGSYAGGKAGTDESIYVSGAGAFAHGIGLSADYDAQAVVGQFNDNMNDTLLEVGNGADDTTRSNAFEVTSDGYIETGAGSGARVAFGAVDLTVATSGWTSESYTAASGTVYAYKYTYAVSEMTADCWADISIQSGSYTGNFAIETTAGYLVIRAATKPSASMTFKINYTLIK